MAETLYNSGPSGLLHGIAQNTPHIAAGVGLMGLLKALGTNTGQALAPYISSTASDIAAQNAPELRGLLAPYF
jgi:hypothetical protein